MFFDRGNHYEFLSLGQELAAPGELQHPQTFPFNFKNVEKQYESYNGINVKLRYFVKVTVSRRMADVVREKDIWVYSYRIPPETNSSIKMDVGIEDCLHIEFEYSKSKYHLKDVIVGRIYFLLVRLKIKHMELSIIRRETTGVAPNQYNESETLVRFEVCPRRYHSWCDANGSKDYGWLAIEGYVHLPTSTLCNPATPADTRIGRLVSSVSCRSHADLKSRRNDPDQALPRRLRLDTYFPGSQQEILNQVLSQSGPYRRRYVAHIPYVTPSRAQHLRQRWTGDPALSLVCDHSLQPHPSLLDRSVWIGALSAIENPTLGFVPENLRPPRNTFWPVHNCKREMICSQWYGTTMLT